MNSGTIKARLDQLQAGLESLQGKRTMAEQQLETLDKALSQQIGAISDCQFWLAAAEKDENAKEPQPGEADKPCRGEADKPSV